MVTITDTKTWSEEHKGQRVRWTTAISVVLLHEQGAGSRVQGQESRIQGHAHRKTDTETVVDTDRATNTDTDTGTFKWLEE